MNIIKVMRLDATNNSLSTLINVDKIIAVIEKKTADMDLYDECGDLVETRTTPNEFVVLLEGNKSIRLDQENYDILTKELSK